VQGHHLSDQFIGSRFIFVLAAILLGNGIKLAKLIFYWPVPPSVVSTPAREG